MNIGMVCYASVGGSGVVATELAHALAVRGHCVHLISSEPPFRWRSGVPGLSFVPVTVPPYPLFREPQYLLALSNTIARVAEERRLDIVHAHYAVPHATAAYLADQLLASTPAVVTPRTVTTLHGTDITLVGSDPSYARVVAFSIERSHGVTAVSRSLKADTIAALGIRHEIRVIPNFLDCAEYRRQPDPELRARLCPPDLCDALVVHVSNFRPVKRVDVALEVFRLIRRSVRARLILVGDGPDRASRSRTCSSCLLPRKASGSRRSKRWRARCRWWRRRSAACLKSSRTASQASSVQRMPWTRWPNEASRCSSIRLSARERPALQRKSFEADTARSSWCRSTKRRIATSSGLDNSG